MPETTKIDSRQLVNFQGISVVCPGCPSIMESAEIPYGQDAGDYWVCTCCGYIKRVAGDPKLSFPVSLKN